MFAKTDVSVSFSVCVCALLFIVSSPLKTVNNNKKHKHNVSHFYFYFCQKMEFWTNFVYFHIFSYKFKVQRTPTAFGLPVK